MDSRPRLNGQLQNVLFGTSENRKLKDIIPPPPGCMATHGGINTRTVQTKTYGAPDGAAKTQWPHANFLVSPK
jgi:hypothetical protein